jgi:hypothetical protein
MKKTLLVLLVTTSGITTQAARGGGEFVFEPSLGYKEETLKLTDYSENATQINMKGALGGLKIGVQSSAGVSLLLAGEYLTGKAKIDPVTNDEPKFKHTIAGFQVGVTAMNAMKIYLGYAPLNKLEFSYENSVNDFSLTGQTYQAGLMFTNLKKLKAIYLL